MSAAPPPAAPGSPALLADGWRSPPVMLAVMMATNGFGFAAWWALINNFARDTLGATGFEIGVQQSIREIPGFLAFTALFWILFLREQTFAWASLLVLGVGIAATGYFPTFAGFYLTTLVMSFGFHYFETMNQSLSLQLLPKDRAASIMGRLVAVAAVAQLVAYGAVFLIWWWLRPGYTVVFLGAGLIALAGGLFAAAAFPRFTGPVEQRRGIVLRRRYWLYYAITFMSGARRQIFMAFGAFLLVERFGFGVGDIALLYLATYALNMVLAPRLGDLVARLGERRTIVLESLAVIAVFVGYALAPVGWVAAALYCADAIFFTWVIAHRTYFQKIADPAEIGPTAAVAFTINHIAAVAIPVTFGLVWLWSPAVVFLLGAALSTVALLLAFLVPDDPEPGHETVFARRAPRPAAAAAE